MTSSPGSPKPNARWSWRGVVDGPKPGSQPCNVLQKRKACPLPFHCDAKDLWTTGIRITSAITASAPRPYLKDIMAETDLLIAIGPRLGEMTTAGYSILTPPVSDQSLVHVFPEPEEIGRVYEPEIALVADTESFCTAVADWAPIAPDSFANRTKDLHEQYVSFSDPASVGDDPLAPYFAHLAEILPDDAILCNGAGNYAGWLHRFYKYRAPGSQLAPTSGSMGYGLPAAIGAAICEPEREIFAIAGDGCFMMTCQEMATAVASRSEP